ncbi:fibronectin type III domain-containing protein [Pleomorphovibrio marinus]|uniref:fibronectin type III domain-containing protein n=1 Tax=Pleomorphovibrio marinus TaxID=2164132 RepID=UPI000E0C5767|nr:fibronectin type III domain-containing protein [Pleomorphovibrio marinus]
MERRRGVRNEFFVWKNWAYLAFCLGFLVACRDELELTVPRVQTLPVSGIQENAAILFADIESMGGVASLTERGFLVGAHDSPTAMRLVAEDLEGLDSQFTVEISGLKSGSAYRVVAYAINSIGKGEGKPISFTTLPGLPELDETTIRHITVHSVEVSGDVVHDGGELILKKGFCWALHPDPSLQSDFLALEENAVFSAKITSLQPGTTYYVRSFAENRIGIAYGEVGEFSTAEHLPDAPTFPTLD